MKKLFQLAPMLELSAYNTMKIIGPYRLERVENHACSFLHGSFSVSIKGESIEIEALQEEQVLLTIQGLQEMIIKKLENDE